MEPIRVLLADDQELFVDSLARVLAHDTDDINIVGIARDGLEAVQLTHNVNPDVILMDVRMPNVDGVEATRRILDNDPSKKVIVLTTFDDDIYAEEAIKSGAVGYLLKNTSVDDLITYIRMVRKGTVLVSDRVANRIVSRACEQERNGRVKKPSWFKRLSKSEMKVLQLLACGLDNLYIARELNLGEQTVKNYVSSVYTKMGVHDRARAVRVAVENGMGSNEVS